MELDPQTVINILFAVIGALIGWIMNTLKSSIQDLRQNHNSLREKVQSMEVLVAGNYVKKEDFDSLVRQLFDKLSSIERKVDQKQDRP